MLLGNALCLQNKQNLGILMKPVLSTPTTPTTLLPLVRVLIGFGLLVLLSVCTYELRFAHDSLMRFNDFTRPALLSSLPLCLWRHREVTRSGPPRWLVVVCIWTNGSQASRAALLAFFCHSSVEKALPSLMATLPSGIPTLSPFQILTAFIPLWYFDTSEHWCCCCLGKSSSESYLVGLVEIEMRFLIEFGVFSISWQPAECLLKLSVCTEK